jgi:hemoglobin-like flavoprotein
MKVLAFSPNAPSGGFAMNDYTISIVKESFDLVEPIAPQAAAQFHENLFEADPSLQRIFTSDAVPQGEKLMQLVERVICKLDQPEALMPALRELGRRFIGKGIGDAQSDVIRGAMLKTLYQGLGVAYTPEVEEAWVEVYGDLVSLMKEATAVPA